MDNIATLFESLDNTKKYEQIINQLSDLILNQQLKKGDKLPPENEIMQQLDCSRNSIREAICALTVMGIIQRKARSGSFISCDNVMGICRPFALTYMLDGGTIHEILSFRYIIEVQIIKILCEKCGDDALDSLENIINVSRHAATLDALATSDLDFHRQLAVLCENKMIIYFMDTIFFLMNEQIKITYQSLDSKMDFEAVRKTLLDNHCDIVVALRTRNRDMAIASIAHGFELSFPDYDFSFEHLCL